MVECKSGATVTPTMAGPLQRLAEAARKKRPKGSRIDMSLVYEPPAAGDRVRVVARGVQAIPWREFIAGF
jgi:hypothetical protein